MAEQKDEKVASANYLMIFLNDVESLSWQGASYINLLAQLKKKYPMEASEKEVEVVGIEEGDQQNLLSGVNYIQGYVFRCYVKFNALKEQIKQFEEYEKNNKGKIKKLYENISSEPIPTKQDIEDFTIAMNELFVQGIVGELLGSAGDILKSLTEK